MLRLIPVLDLLSGHAVHAVAGNRERYRCVEGVLGDGADPVRLLQAMRQQVGQDCCYVADLDAILNGQPQWQLIQQLAGACGRLWLDAGIRSAADLQAVAGLQRVTPILGTETVGDLQQVLNSTTADRIIVSLDLRAGRPVFADPAWQSLTAGQAGERLLELGVRQVLLLDLQAVGTGRGVPTLELCQELKQRLPELFLITGGGVQGPQCVAAAEQAGVDALLVASVLHQGVLSGSGWRLPAATTPPKEVC